VTSITDLGGIQASGVNSVIDLSHVTTITDINYNGYIYGLDGGKVDLRGVTTITRNADQYHQTDIKADGANSIIDLPSLTSFQDGNGYGGMSTLTADRSGTVNLGNTSLEIAVCLTATATGSITGTIIQLNNGAILDGTGTINASVINNSLIQPGGSATTGVLTIAGNYTQTSSGGLRVDLNGSTAGTQYDQFIVTGTASLAGRLDVSNGFTPSVGDTFNVLQAGTVVRDFQDTTLPALSGGVALTKSTSGTAVSLTTISAPVIAVADTWNDEGDASGSRNMAFVISGTAPTGGATISYTTLGGNPGVDYTQTSGSFTVNAGAYINTIAVPIIGNTKLQADRTFQMQASATGVTPVTGTGLIYDDDAPVTLTVATDTASTRVNTMFSPTPSATVKNRYGNLVEGATVNLAVTASADGASANFAGNATTSTAVSNATGVLTVPTLTVNSMAGGPYMLSFSGLGVSGLVVSTGSMSLTNTKPVVTSIVVSGGSGQSASINTDFRKSLQVQVLDELGSGVPGITVTFAAPEAGASGTFAGGVTTAVTDATGVATSPIFTANATVGTYAVTASVPGLTPVNFTLTNTRAGIFIKQDATTQGNWKTAYGADGYNVSQDVSGNNPMTPAYATVTFTDADNYTWSASTTNGRALQKAAASTRDRIAGTWYNADSFSINVQINDGKQHQVALYALDWSSFVRAETIEVIDDSTGSVLDSRSLAGFHDGVYLVWNIAGSVTFRITNTSPNFTNAVISGLFFGGTPQAGAQASFVTADTSTQGNWKSLYGADGYNINQDPSENNPLMPAYANVSVTDASNYSWSGSPSDGRALQRAAMGSTSRIAATWYSSDSFFIHVGINDGKTHQIALYALDWDSYARTEKIQIIDDTTGIVLDTRQLSNFHGGVYLVWNVSGNVTLKVTNTGSSNAVVSGLFFGGPPAAASSARYVTQDNTTQGTWKGTYGGDGFAINQQAQSLPDYASLAVQLASNYLWNGQTSDPRALQKPAPGASGRIASTWYSTGSMSFQLGLTDNHVHQIALYAVDWDRAHRTQTIQVIDTASGIVLDTRSLASFENGVYLIWNVTGNVTFKITNTGTTNAVLSGFFMS